MEKYFTAKSYRHMEWRGTPFEENGKLYVTVSEPCPRCGGHKKISYWAHVDGGICYACSGTGFFTKKVRLYTQQEMEKQENINRKKEERKLKQLEMASEENRKEWMLKHGFSEDGFTWCVAGDDTYAIKDWLKEQGCKFDPLLKWHCGFPLELPTGYSTFSLTFDDIYTWDMYLKEAKTKEQATLIVEKAFQEVEGPSLSEYVGEIGDRLRNITAIYKSARGFMGAYGWTNIYTFKCGDDVLVWFTAKSLNLEKGATVDLTATIKKHEEFRGVKTTQITRAIIMEVK